MFTLKLTGEPMGEPWESNGWDGTNEWEFDSAVDDKPEVLYRSVNSSTAVSERTRRPAGSPSADAPD